MTSSSCIEIMRPPCPFEISTTGITGKAPDYVTSVEKLETHFTCVTCRASDSDFKASQYVRVQQVRHELK